MSGGRWTQQGLDRLDEDEASPADRDGLQLLLRNQLVDLGSPEASQMAGVLDRGGNGLRCLASGPTLEVGWGEQRALSISIRRAQFRAVTVSGGYMTPRIPSEQVTFRASAFGTGSKSAAPRLSAFAGRRSALFTNVVCVRIVVPNSI